VKESRANDVESRLIMLATGGQLRDKVSEDQLKQLLGAVAEQEEEQKIEFKGDVGKGRWDDDDLDDLLEGLK
jgi:programmed cell death protein 5